MRPIISSNNLLLHSDPCINGYEVFFVTEKRIDIHFHCWNLYINNCVIGFKGISVTGGGDLFVNDTVRHGNNFISFRRDYGARWDGPIRLTGCTLKPANTGRVSVLNLQPSDFDYKYPLSLGSSVVIENLCIDYSAVPGSTSPCWMLDIAQFSRNSNGQRLLFPHQLIFRNIKVTGREQGIRLIRISNPYHYMLYHTGGDDGIYLKTNCTIICDNVHLEKMIQASPGDPDQVHLLIGNEKDIKYADENALYPKIVFSDCENVSLCLLNCAANLFLERCTVNTVNANNLQGELNFSNCRLQPNVREVNAVFYQVVSKFGTRFTNCTIHAPVIDGKLAPDLIGNTGFLEINKSIRHYHLNTALGAEVLKYLKGKGIVLNQKFIAQLKSHHILEE